MPEPSIAIQRAAAGFIRDRRRLGAFVNGLLRDPHAAEDLLQEVWVRLAAEVERGTLLENQAAWCRGVARNLIRRHWERQQSAKVVADSSVLEAFLERVEQAFAEADEDADDKWQRRQQALDDCVAALPEKSRRMLSTPDAFAALRGAEIGRGGRADHRPVLRCGDEVALPPAAGAHRLRGAQTFPNNLIS